MLLQFFQKRGVSEAMSTYELFNAVTGLNIPVGAEDEAEFMAEVTEMVSGCRPPVVRVVSRGVSLLHRSWRWRRGTKTTSRNEARKPSR